MREILFRGFHKNENGKETIYLDGREIQGEWVEGFLYINSKGEYEISYYSKAFDIERYTYVVIPETVGQYTGLTDKNGKKIFEGDIVKSCKYDDTYIIRYFDDENYPAFDCVPDVPLCECNGLAFLVNTEGCEVIGNIHTIPSCWGGNKMTKYELENALEQERKINENLRTQLKTAQKTIHQMREEVSCAYDKGYNKGIEEFIKMIEIDKYKYNDHYGHEQCVVAIDDVICNYNYLIKGGIK